MNREASANRPVSVRFAASGRQVRRPAGGTLSSLANALSIAVGTLWAHKLRSFLTVFGVVVGIAAVSLIGAALETLREYAVSTTAQAFGTNTFLVAQVASVGDLSRRQLSDKMRRNPEILRGESEILAARVADTTRTAATLQSIADVKAGNRTFLAASVVGAHAALEVIRDIRVSRGRFFTEEENRRSLGVAVIGWDLAEQLFPVRDPLGKEVRIEGRPFVVIGVQEKRGSSFGSSLDRYAWVPLRAYEKIWGSRRSVTLFAQPKRPDGFAGAREEARTTLRIMRALRPAAADNFDILTPEAGQNFLSRLTGMIAAAIVPISSVALVVAGIVVMNMMLVSVTERTKEIGIRKSLGARNRDIYAQILFESSLLTLLGGAAGLGVSYLGTYGMSGAFGADVRIPLPYVFAAMVVSTLIGIAAGLYPARLATRIPPVEALRAET